MHVHFVGIGGTGIGPLALIAKQAGYSVSGSDKQRSGYIDYLKSKDINSISIGQTKEQIESLHVSNPIDWLVYSSAVAIESPDHPEIVFAKENNIKATKRDEFLNEVIKKSKKKLIAIAGTHGKTTTTAMTIWLFKQLNIPISYSVGAKIPFGEMGNFDSTSEYFVYECDEFDKNFLSFHPYISIITGIDYDHHEIYPTKESYQSAFKEFVAQSEKIIAWENDVDKLSAFSDKIELLGEHEKQIEQINLIGEVNRKNAYQVLKVAELVSDKDYKELVDIVNKFPGVSRRFEKIRENLYSDYAHTIPKIKGCLQLANEVSKNIVVVYEPLTNRRQHYIKDDYKNLFDGVKKLYWVPSYLAREDENQEVLTSESLIKSIGNPGYAQAMKLNESLRQSIDKHLGAGDLVVCLSGGGGGSLDEWVRKEFV